MTQSILQKLRNITLANVHTVLDAIKGLNDIGDYEQYIRDLTESRNQLSDQAAGEKTEIPTLESKISTLKARISEADEQIDVLDDGTGANEKILVSIQVGMTADTKTLARNEQKLIDVKGKLASFDERIMQLESLLKVSKDKLDELRDLDKSAKENQRLESTLGNINVGSAPDMSEAEERLRKKAAVAANQVDRTLNEVCGKSGELSSAEADAAAALAVRRARKAAEKGA